MKLAVFVSIVVIFVFVCIVSFFYSIWFDDGKYAIGYLLGLFSGLLLAALRVVLESYI